jgi:NAD(P)H dehydrogenase (quinone)
MKHLLVVAHPVEGSFTMGLAHAYAAELESIGHSQRTYDLHRMGFNPVLSAQELAPVSADHPASADVAQAQRDILSADALTVIYPLWWLSMPAMLKGYIDRVFARGGSPMKPKTASCAGSFPGRNLFWSQSREHHCRS